MGCDLEPEDRIFHDERQVARVLEHPKSSSPSRWQLSCLVELPSGKEGRIAVGPTEPYTVEREG